MELTTDIETLASRYVAIWNEPDPAARGARVTELWTEDGVQFTGANEHRGHAALEARVTAAYEKLVATDGFRFILADQPLRNSDALTFSTHMVPAGGGDPQWTGTLFLLLGEDGRIERDYQFAR